MKDKNEFNLIIEESMIKNINEINTIKDELTCEICNRIVIKPKQCNSCETIYCEKCINEWKNKNNSCPKRCSKFILTEPSKIIKKLLDKLIIQCVYCKKDFNYENYIYKHFVECYQKNKLVKCPFCSNCEIHNYLIEEYKNKYLKEKEELLNEINKYKQIIKDFENNKNKSNYNKIEYKWGNIQKKKNFILSNNNKNIKIDYSGCYNIYFLDYNFIGNTEYSLGISFDTFGKELGYIYLGFINEIFDTKLGGGYCLCQLPENCFYINASAEKIFEGKKSISVKLENKTNLNLLFVLDLKNKKLNIKNYDSNNSYGIINVTGNSFQFFVGKCNSGQIEYHILP